MTADTQLLQYAGVNAPVNILGTANLVSRLWHSVILLHLSGNISFQGSHRIILELDQIRDKLSVYFDVVNV